MVGINKLPQELQEYIIDQLRDHKPSLKACSLIRRSWVDRSYKHLFFSFRLHDGSGLVDPTDRYPSQRVTDCVRRITLQDIWQILTHVQQADRVTSSESLDPLIARFTHATDFVLDNTKISSSFSLDDRGTWARALVQRRDVLSTVAQRRLSLLCGRFPAGMGTV